MAKVRSADKRLRRVLWEYGLLIVGSAFVALALNWFLVPNRIAAGGVTGLSTVIYYTIGVPVGTTMLALNIPLFLLGLRVLGAHFGAKTVVGTVAVGLLTDFLAPLTASLTYDPALAAVYGGAMTGIGIGLVFRAGGSTGGTDIVAQLLHRWLRLGRGRMLLVVDGFVILLAAIVFNTELALYGLLSAFITARVIDLIQEGSSYAKAAFIISDHSEEIAERVLTEMDRGVTALEGMGMFTGTQRQVLFVIVSRSEISQLQRLVAEIDENAFVVVTDVHEVLGEGFSTRIRTE